MHDDYSGLLFSAWRGCCYCLRAGRVQFNCWRVELQHAVPQWPLRSHERGHVVRFCARWVMCVWAGTKWRRCRDVRALCCWHCRTIEWREQLLVVQCRKMVRRWGFGVRDSNCGLLRSRGLGRCDEVRRGALLQYCWCLELYCLSGGKVQCCPGGD